MKVLKRDGRITEFDNDRITKAIIKAMQETVLGIDNDLAIKITDTVIKLLNDQEQVTVESIHDLVEQVLMQSNRKDVAKQYILYRELRNKARDKRSLYKLLDDDFISKYKHEKSPMQPLGEFVYYRTYSRWLPEEKRREYWYETVRRAVEFNCNLVPNVSKQEAQELFDNMYNLKQFLSGRTMWVGNTEVSSEYGIANYNCSFVVIDEFVKFHELFYALMVGTGVGFRVLDTDVNKLPNVRTNIQLIHEQYNPVAKYKRQDNTSIEFINNLVQITVGDSKEGWVQALDLYFKIISEKSYKKVDTIIINYNNVRLKGEKLKRFGGTASGHESLKNMFSKIHTVISKKNDTLYKKLKPIDCLDICNIIGENVVVGGVRRTAEIGLVGANDKESIEAKAGLFYQDEHGNWIENKAISHRRMSNNSIYYFEKPSREQLNWQMKQMRYSGEPGFINVKAARLRRADFEGLNPCAEILLKDRGLCNLTTVNVMSFVNNNILDETALLNAQRLSTRAGLRMTCLQLELHKWHITQSEDRLLGCSLTGWQDSMNAVNYSLNQQKELLYKLKQVANIEATSYAIDLNIPRPKLVCTIKPEGTISQLPVVSSGVHYSHAPYFIRRIRINANDPLVKVCEDLSYPVHPEVGQDLETCNTKVVEFPVKAPNGKTKYDVTAIEQLEIYKMFQKYYTDHNTSITVHVRNHEWEEVEQWLWDNWDDVVAVSFLSLDDSFYPLLPYEAITEEEYNKRLAQMKPFVPSLISKYEIEEVETDVGNDGCESGICPVR